VRKTLQIGALETSAKAKISLGEFLPLIC